MAIRRKLTAAKLAKAMGIPRTTVTTNRRFKGKFDPKKALKSLESTEEAERRKEIAVADLREIERDKEKGKLLDAVKIGREIDSMFASIRNRLLSVGNKIASQLALEQTPEACQALVDDEIIEALNELSHYPGCTMLNRGFKKERSSSKRRRSKPSVNGRTPTAV